MSVIDCRNAPALRLRSVKQVILGQRSRSIWRLCFHLHTTVDGAGGHQFNRKYVLMMSPHFPNTHSTQSYISIAHTSSEYGPIARMTSSYDPIADVIHSLIVILFSLMRSLDLIKMTSLSPPPPRYYRPSLPPVIPRDVTHDVTPP